MSRRVFCAFCGRESCDCNACRSARVQRLSRFERTIIMFAELKAADPRLDDVTALERGAQATAGRPS